VALKAIPGPFGLQEPCWGPKKATLRGRPALSVVFHGSTADEAAVRAEPDLIPNGRPLCSVVIALLEGAKKPPLSHPARLAAS
jgi:hypothetical protein